MKSVMQRQVLLSLPSRHREVFHREVAKRAGVVGIRHCLQHAAWRLGMQAPRCEKAPACWWAVAGLAAALLQGQRQEIVGRGRVKGRSRKAITKPVLSCMRRSADGSLPLSQPAPGERREGLLADADLGGGSHHSSAGALRTRHRLLARQGKIWEGRAGRSALRFFLLHCLNFFVGLGQFPGSAGF